MIARTALAFAALLLPSMIVAQREWFSDDFERSALTPTWKETTGQWTVADGNVTITTIGYDQLLAGTYYTYDTEPYTIEVRVQSALTQSVYYNLVKNKKSQSGSVIWMQFIVLLITRILVKRLQYLATLRMHSLRFGIYQQRRKS